MRRDLRSDAEHDCDRILYSDAFRRLGGVTQVVAVGEKPLFHTRLTHTLKVAQLARRMAESLEEEDSALLRSMGGVDPAAAEAAGLAHDLGHPPFGHIGEMALDRKCQSAELDGYEGNAQSFRILTKIAVRGERMAEGLQLKSRRTLNGVIKYPWHRDPSKAGGKKWNAYETEADAFAAARQDIPDEAKSLEAELMDWADDITYAVHDLEDFVRAGRVPIARLLDHPRELASFVDAASQQLRKKDEAFDRATAGAAFYDILNLAFGNASHYRGTARDQHLLNKGCRQLINRYASHIELSAEPPFVRVPQGIRYEVEMLKQLTWYYVIHHPGLATLQEGHTRLVEDLFDTLVAWLTTAEARSELFRLPMRLRDLYQLTSEEVGRDRYKSDGARRARAVADYIASLTEDQAVDLHQRLHGSSGASVLDPWVAY